jgi:hypothetical protein
VTRTEPRLEFERTVEGLRAVSQRIRGNRLSGDEAKRQIGDLMNAPRLAEKRVIILELAKKYYSQTKRKNWGTPEELRYHLLAELDSAADLARSFAEGHGDS